VVAKLLLVSSSWQPSSVGQLWTLTAPLGTTTTTTTRKERTKEGIKEGRKGFLFILF
jgi:hypothetical protein